MGCQRRTGEFVPMGRIDVLEIPTNNGRVTCSCTLTELQSGQSQKGSASFEKSRKKKKKNARRSLVFRNVLNLAVQWKVRR